VPDISWLSGLVPISKWTMSQPHHRAMPEPQMPQPERNAERNVEGQPSALVKTILLVDDMDECRVTTKWFLNNFGYTVESVRSAEEALALFNPGTHDVVVTDNSMPGMSGVEMARVIKLRSPATLVVMYSGNPPADQSCLDLVIQRPTHLLTLKEGIDRLLGERK
jgi:CheY-like chemotaxis protein